MVHSRLWGDIFRPTYPQVIHRVYHWRNFVTKNTTEKNMKNLSARATPTRLRLPRLPDDETPASRSRWLRLQVQSLKRQALQAANRGEAEVVFGVQAQLWRRR